MYIYIYTYICIHICICIYKFTYIYYVYKYKYKAPSCDALSSNPFNTYCLWAGIFKTIPTYITPSNSQRKEGGPGDYTQLISCPVPQMNFTDGTVISVSIIRNLKGVDINEIKKPAGTHTLFAVSLGTGGEIARSDLMARYYSGDVRSCGCSALTMYPNQMCDRSGVCMNGSDSGSVDCSGVPFGNAYLDSCKVCSGGLTGVIPSTTCASSNSFDFGKIKQSALGVSYEIIVVVCVVFCMSCFLSIVTYTMRLILMRRGSQGITTTILADNEEESRGLTDAELVAIGEALYSITVYKATNEGSASTIDKGDELPLMECSICLMDVKEGEACRVLPKCSHMFHSTCLESWFHISVCCPLCKRSIRDILNGGEGIVPQRPNRRGGRLSLEPGTVEGERPSRRRQTTPFSSGNEQDPDSLTVPTSPSQINPIRNSLFTWNAFYPTPIGKNNCKYVYEYVFPCI
jgi:hypothetical protein